MPAGGSGKVPQRSGLPPPAPGPWSSRAWRTWGDETAAEAKTQRDTRDAEGSLEICGRKLLQKCVRRFVAAVGKRFYLDQE